jgi:hypothetical protein
MKILLFSLILACVQSVAFATDCTHPNQKGCLDINILNALYDSGNPVFAGLDQMPKSQAEREERMNTVSHNFMKGYVTGKMRAAKARTYLLFTYGMKHMPIERLNSTAPTFDGKGFLLKAGKVEEVDPKTVVPPVFDPVKDPGPVVAVYRVYVDDFLASFQFPWEAVEGMDNPNILICQEDNEGFSPPAGNGKDVKKRGHWMYAEHILKLKELGATGTNVPFSSFN